MILASTALDAASERSVGAIDVIGAEARRLTDLLGANHIAATHDHSLRYMLLRMICNLENDVEFALLSLDLPKVDGQKSDSLSVQRLEQSRHLRHDQANPNHVDEDDEGDEDER